MDAGDDDGVAGRRKPFCSPAAEAISKEDGIVIVTCFQAPLLIGEALRTCGRDFSPEGFPKGFGIVVETQREKGYVAGTLDLGNEE